MGLRLMLGGKRQHEDHEAESRRRGSRMHDDDMEMRRGRTRGAYDDGMVAHYDDDMDMRRGRPRSSYDEEMEMRRRARSMENPQHGMHPLSHDGFVPYGLYMPSGHHHEEDPQQRRIGFDGRQDEMTELRAEMQHLKKEHEKLKKVYASFKELAPNMEGVLEDAAQLIHNPPETWSTYMKRGDLAGIARMETKELVAALDSKRPPKELRKEFVHTIAALMQLAED